MKIITTIIQCLFISCCGNSDTIRTTHEIFKEDSITAKALANTYDRYRKSVFAIYTLCNNEVVCNGSGFLISSNKVATNKHVTACGSCTEKREYCIVSVDGDSDVLSTTEDGCTKKYTKSDTKDLAKLEFAKPIKRPIINIHTSYEPKVGDLTVSMSFPLDMRELNTTVGMITSNKAADPDFDFVSRNDIDHGSSGSPIFDASGECIGITTALVEDRNLSIGYNINCKYLNDF